MSSVTLGFSSIPVARHAQGPFPILHYSIWRPIMRDNGVKSLPYRLAEVGYFQVLWLGEHLVLSQRGDHPADEASAYLSFLVLPWGDWQISHHLPTL